MKTKTVTPRDLTETMCVRQVNFIVDAIAYRVSRASAFSMDDLRRILVVQHGVDADELKGCDKGQLIARLIKTEYVY